MNHQLIRMFLGVLLIPSAFFSSLDILRRAAEQRSPRSTCERSPVNFRGSTSWTSWTCQFRKSRSFSTAKTVRWTRFKLPTTRIVRYPLVQDVRLFKRFLRRLAGSCSRSGSERRNLQLKPAANWDGSWSLSIARTRTLTSPFGISAGLHRYAGPSATLISSLDLLFSSPNSFGLSCERRSDQLQYWCAFIWFRFYLILSFGRLALLNSRLRPVRLHSNFEQA